MNDKERYCDYFNMSAQEFHDYKRSKVTRIFWYILGMLFMAIFNGAFVGWVFLTVLLIWSYYNDAKKEEQWIKDGAITEEQLRN